MLRIVSVSGGKDSTALYCWAIERWGKDGFVAVFADTGHEHPVTLNYVRNLAAMAGGPDIVWVKGDFSERLRKRAASSDADTNAQTVFERNRKWLEANNFTSGSPFLDMMLWKGRAPSSKAQFCTEHVKLRPIAEWLETIRGDRDAVMYTGIRAGESERRSKMPEREWMGLYDCYTERPLLHWTEHQVFDFLKVKGVPPNPLYDHGFVRVGCFPCIHARKFDLARLPDWAWDKLADWEALLGRSWFSPGLVPGKFIPTIQDAREWATTSRGGRQQDMFAPDQADVPSCMSTWGACE